MAVAPLGIGERKPPPRKEKKRYVDSVNTPSIIHQLRKRKDIKVIDACDG